jgi:hypothetical protein
MPARKSAVALIRGNSKGRENPPRWKQSKSGEKEGPVRAYHAPLSRCFNSQTRKAARINRRLRPLHGLRRGRRLLVELCRDFMAMI